MLIHKLEIEPLYCANNLDQPVGFKLVAWLPEGEGIAGIYEGNRDFILGIAENFMSREMGVE